MQFFKWTAIVIPGNKANGIIWATNKAEITERLFSQQKALLYCKPCVPFFYQKKDDPRETIALLQHLSSLLHSGVHLNKALIHLAHATPKITTRCYIESIAWHLQQGISLIEALDHTPLFPTAISHVIAHAHVSGILHETLSPIIEYQMHMAKFRAKFFSMLFMPLISVIIFILLFWGILFFVIPRLQSLSSIDNTSYLSFISTISTYLQQHPLAPLYILIAIATIIITGITFALFTSMGKTIKKGYIQKIIKHSELFSAYQATQLFQLLSLLQTAHNTLPLALKTCRSCMPILAESIKKMEQDIQSGTTFSTSFQNQAPFKKSIIKKIIPFIHIGEQTSNCAHSYHQCAQYLFIYTQTKSQKILRYLQPALILFLGLCTTILISSLYLPILSLGEHIHI